MSAPTRPIIKLKQQAPVEDREFRIDFVDVLLPCRQFTVAHKVAEVGAVSLVTEFMLRLIHAMGEIDETGASTFFGFDSREMNFALADLEANSYVERHNGMLSLTRAGQALFQYGQGTPQIYTVQGRISTQGFDLLSFAPQERIWLERFESKLEELPVLDPERVSTASQEIRSSFKHFFGEVSARTEKDVAKHLSLYSIDSVTPERRFSAPVSFHVKARASRPGAAEADLSTWRPPQEIEDRPRIVESIAAHVEKLKSHARPDDKRGYAQLLEFGGEFFRDFIRKGELAVERFFSSTLARAGELRTDRPTVPIVGTFFVKENVSRLTDALRYGKSAREPGEQTRGLCWLVPDTNWGYTRVLPTTLSALSKNLKADSDSVFRTVGLTRRHLRPHQKEAFSEFENSVGNAEIPSSLEVLWIPGILSAALVHAPVKVLSGVPIPLGFLSFDAAVIERVAVFLKERFPVVAAIAERAMLKTDLPSQA